MKTYVDWAVKQGFAVIDVNLPKHIADGEDKQEYQPNDANDFRIREATQLLTYLWDNYIDLNESTHVFLMGTNTGHGAIINFIKGNEERSQERITGAFSFVEDVTLQSCKSATNDLLAQWYYAIAQVFVAFDHNLWHSELLTNKIKKRFGKVHRSKVDSITDMLIEHKEVIVQSLLDRTKDWANEPSVDGDQANVDDMEIASPPKSKLPPVGNFALSSRPQPPAASRTPRNRSPAKTPPTGALPRSPGQRPPRSPLVG